MDVEGNKIVARIHVFLYLATRPLGLAPSGSGALLQETSPMFEGRCLKATPLDLAPFFRGPTWRPNDVCLRIVDMIKIEADHMKVVTALGAHISIAA